MKIKLKILMASAICLAAMFASCSSEPASNNENAYDSNQALENILTRRSVRTFSDRNISPDTVEILLRAAMSAPTAVNKQPWKFVVVRNSELKKQLGDSIQNMAKTLNEAPVVIIVCGDQNKMYETVPTYWVQDCSAATENLLLAAHSLGLGAVWCGVYPMPDRIRIVRGIFNLSPELIPLNYIPVGYPGAETEIKDKWKTENIEYID